MEQEEVAVAAVEVVAVAVEGSKYIPYDIGINYRADFYPLILDKPTPIDFLEITTEHFLWHDKKSEAYDILCAIKEAFPIILHGLSLSIASTDSLNKEYLFRLKHLANDLNTTLVSDHLSWTGINGVNIQDLFPIPYTNEALEHLIPRIKYVQNYLERPFAIENPSTYLQFSSNHYSEIEFIRILLDETSCSMLLDVNNVYVNAYNHGFCPYHYINHLPTHAIQQIHLAGYDHHGTYLHDTHGRRVSQEVWDLYQHTIKRLGNIATVIEWDNNTPPLEVICREANKARAIISNASSTQSDQKDYALIPPLSYKPSTHHVKIPYKKCLEQFQNTILQNTKNDVEWIAVTDPSQKAPEKLDIYKKHYTMPLLECLHEDYPATTDYMGRASHFVFHKYTDNHPPTHSNADSYGDALPDFLSEQRDNFSLLDSLIYPIDFIIDLCLFEKTMKQLSNSITSSDPTHHMIHCYYDIINAYDAWLDAKTFPDPIKKNCEILLYRHGHEIYYSIQ